MANFNIKLNIVFSNSYKEYEDEMEKFILGLDEPIAKEFQLIEESMRMFTHKVYGYLPTAGEMKWPVLEPNYIVRTEKLIPFHEAYSYGITDAIVHFYTADRLFMRVFRNPEKYLSFLSSCKAVIGTDMSQYAEMPAEMRFRHSWCNIAMSSYLQNHGVNVYPNVTWSLKDSYSYSFPTYLAGSVIAINSNGVHKSDLSLYRWKSGYKAAISTLSPLHVIRYGQPVDGEEDSISSYFVNERLIQLRNGSKRKS